MNMQIIISYFKCNYGCEREWRKFGTRENKFSKCNCGIRCRAVYIRYVTPMDDDIKCFGHYSCTQCYNKWTSANTWINYGQKCFNCKTKCSPYFYEDNWKLPNSPYGKSLKHLTAECEKCYYLGYNCRSMVSNDSYFYNYQDTSSEQEFDEIAESYENYEDDLISEFNHQNLENTHENFLRTALIVH